MLATPTSRISDVGDQSRHTVLLSPPTWSGERVATAAVHVLEQRSTSASFVGQPLSVYALPEILGLHPIPLVASAVVGRHEYQHDE